MPLHNLPRCWNTVAYGLLILFLHVKGHDLSEANPIRNSYIGQVQGKLVNLKDTKSGVHTFLGIPFAKPPVGPMCFASPEAPEPWSGVRDGTSEPAKCLQNDDIVNLEGLKRIKMIMPHFSMSEDCLYLNIYVLAHANESSNLPVMVWLHGGALVMGMASIHDGSRLRMWLLPSTTWESWAFTGDTSVSFHVVSPKDSSIEPSWRVEVALLPIFISNSAETVFTTVANLSGCKTSNSEALVQCLRSKSEAEILAINKSFRIKPAVVDRKFLPRHPKELLASADFHPVPSIIGVNNDEYGWILPSVFEFSQTIKKITRRNLRAILKSLPYWPVSNQDDQYLQLDIHPSVSHAVKARRLQFLTKTLPPEDSRAKGRS